jgi:protein-L-isoaspartate O-methyltransferase
MRHTITLIVILGVVLGLPVSHAVAQSFPGLQSQPEYQIHPDDTRDSWQQPKQVIDALAFSPTETVAVIETGFPYFAPRIAPLVKKLYAINNDSRSFEGRGALPPSISTIVSTSSDPKTAGLNVDTVVIVDTLHLIPQPTSYYLKLFAGIKPGGRLVIIDRVQPAVIPDRLDQNSLEATIQGLGHGVTNRFTFLPSQFFIVIKF